MGERIYDKILICGCQISSDKGGGLIPCCYPGYGATPEQEKRCSDAWKEWRKTDDYKEHNKEVKRRNV